MAMHLKSKCCWRRRTLAPMRVEVDQIRGTGHASFLVLLGGLIGGSLMGNCVKGKNRKPNGDVLKVRQQQLRPASGPKPPGVTFTAQALAPRSPAFASHRGCFRLRGSRSQRGRGKTQCTSPGVGPYLVRGQPMNFLLSKSGLNRGHSNAPQMGSPPPPSRQRART